MEENFYNTKKEIKICDLINILKNSKNKKIINLKYKIVILII